MPKVKTHKGTTKRFRKTKTGKLIHRTSGQDHYNSREGSKTTMNKRSDTPLNANNNRLKKLIPYK